MNFTPKFDKNGLITAVVQDVDTHQVLMVAYMSRESLQKTFEIGEAVYFSRSHNTLWHKGAISGSRQKIVNISTDCDQDCLLLQVRPTQQGACHNGYVSCFYRTVQDMHTLTQNHIPQVFDPNTVCTE